MFAANMKKKIQLKWKENPISMFLFGVFSFLFGFREVYHTKRMQHVITVKWTSDNKYILCGSDEMNIRLWKANASEKLGVVSNLGQAMKLCFAHQKRV